MKLFSRILMAIGAVSVLLFIFLLIGLVLYSLTPSLKEDMKAVSVSAEAAKSCNNKIDAFKSTIEKAAVAKETKEVSFTLTQEEINSKLIEILSEGDVPFKEASVNLVDNKIWAYMELTSVTPSAKIILIGDASVVKNEIQANIETFELGKLPLPSSATEQVSSIINAIMSMESPFSSLPIKITSIGVDGNSVIIKGLTVPKT